MAASKYETVVLPNLKLIEKWARDGATEEEIAKRLHISRSTWASYKKRHSDISDTLKRTKEVVDGEVENALLRRALGYEYEEITKERKPIEGGGFDLVVTKVVKRQVVPDVLAQMYWLKNRMPGEWRDAPLPPPDGEDIKRRTDEAAKLRAALLDRNVGGVDDDL